MKENTITVVDAPCGYGKTTWAIQEMNAHKDTNYIYCTPLLEEIDRIQKETRYDLSIPYDEEHEANKRFRQPTNKNKDGTKIEGFNRLLAYNKDIAVSHTTFLNATEETLELIRNGGYTLILDEALEVVTEFNDVQTVEHNERQSINPPDMRILLERKLISIEKSGRVVWRGGEYGDEHKFSEVERFAKLNRLYCVDEKLLLVIFPPELFEAFEKIYILTYMFDGSIMKYYFDLFRIGYEMKSVGSIHERKALIDYDRTLDAPLRERCKKLIHICDNGRMNSYGKNAFSANWYKGATTDDIKELKNNIQNYFSRYLKRQSPKASKGDIMWTTYTKYEDKLKGKGYTSERQLTAEERELPEEKLKEKKKELNCFVPCNARATNEYRNRWALAYCVSMSYNPMMNNFFRAYGTETNGHIITPNNDLFALSNMIQWVFRSRIRDGKEIYIYIPSPRMRNLFVKWLDGEI